MEKHKRVLAILLIIMGCFYLAGTAFLALFGTIVANNIIQTDPATPLLPAALTGTILLVPLAGFGLLHIFTGRAFRGDAPWARITLWILAILNLGNIPLGTAFGAYTIWVLVKTREEIKKLP